MKGYSLKIGNFRLGLRTVKTAIAVMCCLLIFRLFMKDSDTYTISAMISSLSAVFSMREDISTTLKFGRSRIIGNSLGGLFALCYTLIHNKFPHSLFVEVFCIPLFVLLFIVVSDGINNNAGIIGGISALLIISLTIPNSSSVAYTVSRVLDTFIGTFVAFIVNGVIKPHKREEIEEIDTKVLELQKHESELAELKEKLKYYEERDRQKESEK